MTERGRGKRKGRGGYEVRGGGRAKGRGRWWSLQTGAGSGEGAFCKTLLLSPQIVEASDVGLQQVLFSVTLDQLEPQAGLAEISQL